VRPASFGARFAARVIDYTLLAILSFVFFIAASFIASAANPAGFHADLSDPYYDAWAYLVFFGWGVTLFFYDWLFHVGTGRTVGKMVLSLRVVRTADGGPLTQGQAIGRAALFGLPQTVCCIGQAFTLVDCLAGLSEDGGRVGATLHDRASRTTVVRT
jgi:uncharacterized RDD family membrane protein YckC